MRKYEHGGDTFAEEKKIIDFSVNINPLGMPRSAMEMAVDAVKLETSYPDPFCRKLSAGLSARYGVPAENIVCGNGASDLIMRLCACRRPERVLVPAPGFSEYGRSAALYGAKVLEFAMSGTIEDTRGAEMVFVCRPNNPDGSLMPLDDLRSLAELCESAGAFLVVDECFLEFTDAVSALALLGRHKNIVVINAFTKTYALAGLRLGFMISADTQLLDEVYSFGTPWSVSAAAQAAGYACCAETEFLEKTRKYIEVERKRLVSGLERLGLEVFPSEANFLLIRAPESLREALAARNCASGQSLRELLAARGIKVRDCRSFTGLDDSYMRIGVRIEEENSALLGALEDIING